MNRGGLAALGCCRHSLRGFYRFLDHIDHDLRLRQHHHVAARGLGRRGAHAFGKEALAVRLDSTVVLGDDVPAWLRPPGRFSHFRLEQVWSRHALSRPNQLLFLLGQVACEGIDAFRKQPETSATSTCETTSVFGKLDGCVWDVSSASGANAAMYTSPATLSSVPAPVMTLPP